MLLVVSPLSPSDTVNHGLFHFLVGFLNAEPDPKSFPDSRVERGAGPHNVVSGNELCVHCIFAAAA
jgi:hypothetical protein